MDLPSEIVLLFERDADLLVFEPFARATGWVEAIDVDEGEYTAAYSADGAVSALTAPEGGRSGRSPGVMAAGGALRRL
ncbi:hypothetical protein [Streptomyces fradiae]|uniref:hypothetical protein n=1 Tax=Streptomyces fradiae TaxID=1906 RepID=UPI003404A7D9